MDAKTLLSGIVAELRAIPTRLSSDDSPFADPWEEIKEQVQHGLSFHWPAYLETMKALVEGKVATLTPVELLLLCTEIKVRPEDQSKIHDGLLRRLLAKARREKVRYAPFDFGHFWYFASLGFCIYVKIIERTGTHTCRVAAYSTAARLGDQGEINLAEIDRTTDVNIMTDADFEKARALNWPERWG